MKKRAHHRSIIDDLAITAFALISVGILVFELLNTPTVAQRGTFRLVDTIIAIIFLIEFFTRFKAVKEKRLFFRHHWWELLAGIPITTSVTQALRGLQIIRIIRVAARLEVMGVVIGKKTKHTYLLESISTVLALLFIAATIFFTAEGGGQNPHVHTLFDAFYWATTTYTTAGYGDITPITNIGRLLAILLMLLGIVSAGLVAGAFAKYLSTKKK